MKRKVILTAGTLVLVIAAAFMAKANARFDAMYTDSVNPSQCQYPGSLPASCTITNTGTICTATAGAKVYTFYQGTSCIVPFYKSF